MSIARCAVVLLVGLALELAPLRAYAGYASVASPPGWSSAGGQGLYGGSAANAPWVGGRASAAVTHSVAGRVVTMPASMRIASNAASFAVNAVRLTPGALAAGALGAWLAGYGLSWLNGQWTKQDPGSTSYSSGPYPQCTSGSVATTFDCIKAIKHPTSWPGDRSLVLSQTVYSNPTPTTWYASAPYGYSEGGDLGTTAGGTRPANDADFAAPSAAPRTELTDQALNQLRPTTPLPVELPVLNPDPAFAPVPVIVPWGQPVPLPGTSPQQYRQPVIRVVPSPYVGDPFRVDEQPGELVGNDPAGLVDPVSSPTTSPSPLQKVDVETCGLPDTPKCKIDETGTETGSADDKLKGKQPAEVAELEMKRRIEDPPKGPTALPWALTFSMLGIPAGSCQPFYIGAGGTRGVTINLCSNTLVLLLRDLLAWSMAAVTILYVWRRANDAPQFSKG